MKYVLSVAGVYSSCGIQSQVMRLDKWVRPACERSSNLGTTTVPVVQMRKLRRLNNLSEVTQLISGRAIIHTLVVLLIPTFIHEPMVKDTTRN